MKWSVREVAHALGSEFIPVTDLIFALVGDSVSTSFVEVLQQSMGLQPIALCPNADNVTHGRDRIPTYHQRDTKLNKTPAGSTSLSSSS
eukprot:CAMPEP_0184712494 /NCGR_PEP_ID=MMETSP0314-20130426/3033_1 /TAXON_ID=38298 /ORGANISM="Rhodella maculata, Strain CCMP 736" /LENGTH=88 /DNA_ID=CAMNT_0027174949 /DNA_START=93 /DNA_END=357 /DNA_ORIENTATION=-